MGKGGKAPKPVAGPNQAYELASKTNIALLTADAPTHIRIEKLACSLRGTITAGVTNGVDDGAQLRFREVIRAAVRRPDSGIVDIR